MEETNTRRIVILGKTGAGKSSLANTLLGAKEFNVNNSPNSETLNCQSKIKSVNEKSVQLIDTPGLFDTRSTETSPGIIQCLIECAPGPHAFLLVLKVEKFTQQEEDVVKDILKYFSEEALKYTTVVFTRGDDLPEGMKIKEWVNQSKALRDLVQTCGSRCHVFDNKYWNNTQDQYRNNKVQVEELLNTIDTTVRENRGEFYTNELLMKVENKLQRKGACFRESEKPDILKEFLTKLAGVSTGFLLGALLGVPVLIGGVIIILTPAAIKAAAGAVGTAVGTAAAGAVGAAAETAAATAVGAAAEAGAAVGSASLAVGILVVGGTAAVVGGVIGGWIGYDAAEQAETPGEAAKRAAEAVWTQAKELFTENKQKKQ